MATKGPIATLGGIPLLGIDVIDWQLTSGTDPYTTFIELNKVDALKLLEKGGGPHTLIMGKLAVQQIFALQPFPGRLPSTLTVEIADLRWTWSRKFASRSFNIRRRTGEIFLEGEGRIENRIQRADVKYAPWSTSIGGAAWDPIDVLEEIFKALDITKVRIPPINRQIFIEDFDLEGSGASVIDDVLNYLTGYSLYIDHDGTVVVYDKLDKSESVIASRVLNKRHGTGGFIGRTTKQNIRPIEVEVLFDREQELRFDYREGDASVTQIRGNEDLILENVMPSPDKTVFIPSKGGVPGRTVGIGTWITFEEALSAWESTPSPNAPRALNQSEIRRLWLAPQSYMRHLYALDESGNIDPVWLRRLSAIRKHWRTTFRVLPEWRDRLRGIRANRIGILDPERGTRAPSQAFMDYISVPSARGVFIRSADSHRIEMGWVTQGFNEELEKAFVAPADIQILDEDQGVIRVYLLAGPFGEEEKIVPGRIENHPVLTQSGDAALLTWAQVPLSPVFNMSVVVTGHVVSPNNKSRFHKEVRGPEVMKKVLGLATESARGPVWTVKFEPGPTSTARFFWDDSFSQDIKDGMLDGSEFAPNELLINKELIEAIADAVAARVYEQFTDRQEGTSTVGLDPTIKPTGTADTVHHRTELTGEQVTMVELPPVIQLFEVIDLLPLNHQRALRRGVLP